MKIHVSILLMAGLVIAGCAKVEDSKPAAQQKAAPKALPSLSAEKQTSSPAALGNTAAPAAASATVPATTPVGAADANGPKRLTDQELTVLNYAVYKYKEQFGHFPKSLQDMVGTPHLARVPVTPPDQKIVYDPATGIVKTEKP